MNVVSDAPVYLSNLERLRQDAGSRAPRLWPEAREMSEHELGHAVWIVAVEMPSAGLVLQNAQRLRKVVAIGRLVETHIAYRRVQSQIRLARLAAALYEEARARLVDVDPGDTWQIMDAIDRLELAVGVLHRAGLHAESIRRHLGNVDAFRARPATPSQRGPRPFAITKVESRTIGDLEQVNALRDALEHADERLGRGEEGDTMLIPRRLGVSFDQHSLRYVEMVKIAERLVDLGDKML